MKIEIVRRHLSTPLGSSGIPDDFLKKQTTWFLKKLIERKILSPQRAKKLLLAFVSLSDIQALNLRYLKKDLPTDILSFSPTEKDSLGELVLCEEQIQNQAEPHGLLFEQEMMYLILHGLLHLLGYRHEKGGPEAKKMYQLQDSLFSEWIKTHKKSNITKDQSS